MSSIQSGSRIADRYRIESVIATGGMGAVYRALDERLNRPVAVKLLLAELAADTTQVARFEREAIASARLSHPGIVQVHDFGKTDAGVGYLVMELIQGRTLATVLDESRLPTARAVDYTDQALAALEAAHGAGIIHRDLKPANLMLVPLGGGREHVKILDFGIAQLKSGEAYTRLTATGDIIGTPSFMAPEQARSEPCDARTDVYAMGMVLWCALTGQKPWPHHHIAQIVIAVQAELPLRADLVNADVPKAVATVVEKAIAKRAEDRFASAAEFAAALKKASSAIAPETRAPVPETVANPLAGRMLSPTPVRAPSPAPTPAPAPSPSPALSPAPTRLLAPGQLPTPAPAQPLAPLRPFSTPTPFALAAPPTPTPAPPAKKKPRWWLRILVAVFVLGTLGAIGTVVALLALGIFGLSAFASLPNARHPAGGSPGSRGGFVASDPTCAAAARCCRLDEGDDCDDYLVPPLDLDECRAAIGSYGDDISQSGGDASPCSPTYSGP